jgi:hypothetical protein
MGYLTTEGSLRSVTLLFGTQASHGDGTSTAPAWMRLLCLPAGRARPPSVAFRPLSGDGQRFSGAIGELAHRDVAAPVGGQLLDQAIEMRNAAH